MLDPSKWPSSIMISAWYRKPQSQPQGPDDKRRRVVDQDGGAAEAGGAVGGHHLSTNFWHWTHGQRSDNLDSPYRWHGSQGLHEQWRLAMCLVACLGAWKLCHLICTGLIRVLLLLLNWLELFSCSRTLVNTGKSAQIQWLFSWLLCFWFYCYV